MTRPTALCGTPGHEILLLTSLQGANSTIYVDCTEYAEFSLEQKKTLE